MTCDTLGKSIRLTQMGDIVQLHISPYVVHWKHMAVINKSEDTMSKPKPERWQRKSALHRYLYFVAWFQLNDL
jgi:hypothetical protein